MVVRPKLNEGHNFYRKSATGNVTKINIKKFISSHISVNLMILNLITVVKAYNYEKFIRSFSIATASLYGKGITLNGIHVHVHVSVDRVVEDLNYSAFPIN